MARLIKVIDRSRTIEISLMPDGSIERTYIMLDYHWELIDTTPAEVAYFNTLGDNE